MIWFMVTLTLTLASRCYFIGGVLWDDHYLSITVAIFVANLTFTFYSLVVVFLYIKHILVVANDASSVHSNSLSYISAGGNNNNNFFGLSAASFYDALLDYV